MRYLLLLTLAWGCGEEGPCDADPCDARHACPEGQVCSPEQGLCLVPCGATFGACPETARCRPRGAEGFCADDDGTPVQFCPHPEATS
jgi:hypothetical protein